MRAQKRKENPRPRLPPRPLSPPGGATLPPGISTRIFAPTPPLHSVAFKGLREILTAFPPPSSQSPQACSLTRCSRESAAASAARPPLSRPSAGREPACLSRPIYHRHTNNTRESAETLPRSPCSHGSRRAEPEERDRACGVGVGAYPRGPPRAHRGFSPALAPAPGAPASPAAGAVTALRAGQSYFYLV